MDQNIQKLEEVLEESEAYAAFIFGSYARDEEYRDIDVAVFTDNDIEEIVREAPGIFDIQRFSDLPMYIQYRVLEEGDMIYCTDEDRLYDETIDFARRYEDFRPIYEDYLEGVKSRG